MLIVLFVVVDKRIGLGHCLNHIQVPRIMLRCIHDFGFLSQAAQPVCAGPYIMRRSAADVNSRFRDALGISAARELGRGVGREAMGNVSYSDRSEAALECIRCTGHSHYQPIVG